MCSREIPREISSAPELPNVCVRVRRHGSLLVGRRLWETASFCLGLSGLAYLCTAQQCSVFMFWKAHCFRNGIAGQMCGKKIRPISKLSCFHDSIRYFYLLSFPHSGDPVLPGRSEPCHHNTFDDLSVQQSRDDFAGAHGVSRHRVSQRLSIMRWEGFMALANGAMG